MNRQEATQYAASGIGVLAGTNIDFRQPLEAPCVECGSQVDLTSAITVNIVRPDGTEAESEMTEANARVLLMQVGIAPPLVMCGRHEHLE